MTNALLATSCLRDEIEKIELNLERGITVLRSMLLVSSDEDFHRHHLHAKQDYLNGCRYSLESIQDQFQRLLELRSKEGAL